MHVCKTYRHPIYTTQLLCTASKPCSSNTSPRGNRKVLKISMSAWAIQLDPTRLGHCPSVSVHNWSSFRKRRKDFGTRRRRTRIHGSYLRNARRLLKWVWASSNGRSTATFHWRWSRRGQEVLHLLQERRVGISGLVLPKIFITELLEVPVKTLDVPN